MTYRTFEELLSSAVDMRFDHGDQSKPSTDILSNSMFAGAVEALAFSDNAMGRTLGLMPEDQNPLPYEIDAPVDATRAGNQGAGGSFEELVFDEDFGPITDGPFQTLAPEPERPSIEDEIRALIRRI